MLYLWIFLIVVGLVLLVKGADFFVDGAAGIAGKCRISPLVIGLTVVAFGTSMPELAVSVTSAATGSTDLSIGNVVGSNIANILLILGVSALVCKLPVRRASLVLDIPVLLIASVLLIGLGIWGGALEWWDGLIFLAVFAVYMVILMRGARKDPPIPEEEKIPKSRLGIWYAHKKERTWFLVVLTVLGLGMVVGGGTLLVEGAKYVARAAGMSERVIGLTVVAVGTSLPELVTSVVAASKKQTDIAVGNIIGSNIFNILLIVGVSSLVAPLEFRMTDNLIDALVALTAAVLLYWLAMFDKHRLGKAAGIVFLLGYAAYYVYLFLPA
ncbi:MAG TPA: calcium/sodium antiporter [Firmicutes bacterium]|nr:calcium/sodium antiporter [Bacillota bacterium]